MSSTTPKPTSEEGVKDTVTPGNSDASEAWNALKSNNAAFATGNNTKILDNLRGEVTGKFRQGAALKQAPYACVFTCSDSRVSPEIIFTEGLSQLFVVRNAGNVIDNHVIGSIQYAVEHLDVNLVVVNGLRSEPREQAAAAATGPGVAHTVPKESPVVSIFKKIHPHLPPPTSTCFHFDTKQDKPQTSCVSEVGIRHVRATVTALTGLIPNVLIREGVPKRIVIIGAIYGLKDGHVHCVASSAPDLIQIDDPSDFASNIPHDKPPQ